MATYYQILGLDKNATSAQITEAYRRLSMRHHPDRNNGDPRSEAKFKAIRKAYTTLKDPKQRAIYDRTDMEFRVANPPRRETKKTGALLNTAERINQTFSKFNDYALKRRALDDQIIEAQKNFKAMYPGIKNLFNRLSHLPERRKARKELNKLSGLGANIKDMKLLCELRSLHKGFHNAVQSGQPIDISRVTAILSSVENQIEERNRHIDDSLKVLGGQTRKTDHHL